MTVVICYNYFIVIVYFFFCSFLLIMTFYLKAQPASISFAICGLCRIVSVFFFKKKKKKKKKKCNDNIAWESDDDKQKPDKVLEALENYCNPRDNEVSRVA